MIEYDGNLMGSDKRCKSCSVAIATQITVDSALILFALVYHNYISDIFGLVLADYGINKLTDQLRVQPKRKIDVNQFSRGAVYECDEGKDDDANAVKSR